MAAPKLLTYSDCIDAAVDFLAGTSTSASQRDIRRWIWFAYNEFGDEFGWSFLKKQGRVHLKAMESTGTCSYDHSGGTYERQLTLTPDDAEIWPSWAQDATVRVGDIPCRVESRQSDTVLTLDVVLNPGADVASGTSFQIYPTCYTLPPDFGDLVQPWGSDSWRFGRKTSRDEILAMDKYRNTSGGVAYFAIAEVSDLVGSLGLYIWPASDATEPLDFTYRRRPRQLRFSGKETAESAGTISTTSGSTSVAGSGTSFSEDMVGSVIRIGSGSTIPTGLDGLTPFAEERIIASYTSATAITLDAAASATRSGVKYVVSDPIDLHQTAHNAFLLCVLKSIAIGRNMDQKGEMIALYQDALFKARGGDRRVTQQRVAGRPAVQAMRFRDYPAADDVE
jgi:hypothetical protein